MLPKRVNQGLDDSESARDSINFQTQPQPSVQDRPCYRGHRDREKRKERANTPLSFEKNLSNHFETEESFQ